jgi:hypothetical protein
MLNRSLREHGDRILIGLHYRILSAQPLSRAYRALISFYFHCRAFWAFGRFRLGLRPGPTRIFRWIARNTANRGAGNAMPSPQSRALIHIPFHFSYGRLGYLREVVQSLLQGPFAEVELVIDTNSHETKRWLKGFDKRVRFELHASLGHPYLLTWACRKDFRARREKFDLFIYAEDDILITPQAISAWLRHRSRLALDGSYVGFVRAEVDRSGRLVASDFLDPASVSDIVEVDGSLFLATSYFYQACWIYDRQLLDELMASPRFEPPDASAVLTEDVRAIAALGLTRHALRPGRPARSLIPLTRHLQISEDCFVYHLPSNYGRTIGRPFGNLATIPVERLIKVADVALEADDGKAWRES